MFPVVIPESFIASTVAREGTAGRKWIRELPGVVQQLCARWHLKLDGPALHGYVGVVFPVLQLGVERVLKVSWVDEDSAQEPLALRLWGGRGAVMLFEEDEAQGAMLLERLSPRRSLLDVPMEEALLVAGRLLRRLAIPAHEEIRPASKEAMRWREEFPERWESAGRPFPRDLLEEALRVIDELATSGSSLIVNTDLHYENVLAGIREPWLAIDPKVLAGDPELGVAQLLWNRFDELEAASDLVGRLSVLTGAADLDPNRARGWSTIRIIDYWLWARAQGFTGDSERCRRLLRWLHPGFDL